MLGLVIGSETNITQKKTNFFSVIVLAIIETPFNLAQKRIPKVKFEP